jgi:TonB family protein
MSAKTRGIVLSVFIHVLILVLLILFGFTTQLPLPGEEGIVINFGDNDQGMGLVEPRPSPLEQPSQAQPTQVEEEETPITQDFEEAPSLPVPKPKPEPKPKTEKPKETKPTPEKPKEEKPPVEEKPREVDQRILFPGQKTGGDTSGEGVTGQNGNQGDPSGSIDSQSKEGGNTGGGEGPSSSIDGRKALLLPPPEYTKQVSGKVVIQVTVDRNGNVTKVTGPFKGSTNYDPDLVSAAKKAALKAKFDLSPNAPAYQTGTITYVFKLQQ